MLVKLSTKKITDTEWKVWEQKEAEQYMESVSVQAAIKFFEQNPTACAAELVAGSAPDMKKYQANILYLRVERL